MAKPAVTRDTPPATTTEPKVEAPPVEAPKDEAPAVEVKATPKFDMAKPFEMVHHGGTKHYLQGGKVYDRATRELKD